MRRDMDLLRAIVLALEELPLELGDAWNITAAQGGMQTPGGFVSLPGHDAAAVYHHMELIQSAGFIEDGGGGGPMLGFTFMGLTWAGHDFADSVRSPMVWTNVKAKASAAGSFTVQILVELAKAEIKRMVGLS